jgi:hypothetical protein
VCDHTPESCSFTTIRRCVTPESSAP